MLLLQIVAILQAGSSLSRLEGPHAWIIRTEFIRVFSSMRTCCTGHEQILCIDPQEDWLTNHNTFIRMNLKVKYVAIFYPYNYGLPIEPSLIPAPRTQTGQSKRTPTTMRWCSIVSFVDIFGALFAVILSLLWFLSQLQTALLIQRGI